MRKILHTNPIFKMVKTKNHFKFFNRFKMLLSAIETFKQQYYSRISKTTDGF